MEINHSTPFIYDNQLSTNSEAHIIPQELKMHLQSPNFWNLRKLREYGEIDN